MRSQHAPPARWLSWAGFAAAAEAVPAKFWGVVPQVEPSFEQLQRLHRGGVDSVRIPVGWNASSRSATARSIGAGVDPAGGKHHSAGIEVLPFLSGAPTWAVPQVWVPGSHKASKRRGTCRRDGVAIAGWSAFVAAAAERYGPGGSFWAEHPTLPERPIRNWQIWNEENFKYFVARPNPAEYGKLVRASYPGDQSGRRWRSDRTRRPLRQPERGDPESEAPAGLLRRRLPRTDVQDNAGGQVEVRRRCPASIYQRIPAD